MIKFRFFFYHSGSDNPKIDIGSLCHENIHSESCKDTANEADFMRHGDRVQANDTLRVFLYE